MKAASTGISPIMTPITCAPCPTVSVTPSKVTDLSAACLGPRRSWRASRACARCARRGGRASPRRSGPPSCPWRRSGSRPWPPSPSPPRKRATAPRRRRCRRACRKAYPRAVRCRRACSGSSPVGATKELDDALAVLLGELVAQDELVGPGDGVAGLVLARRVHHQEVHAQRRWS